MKKALAVMALGLMTASIGAWAKDWKEVRFGVDASYAPFESRPPMASWSASTSIWAMKSVSV